MGLGAVGSPPIPGLEVFEDTIEGGCLDVLVLPAEALQYDAVEFAEGFPEFGVEMVFDLAIGPAWELTRDDGPLVSEFVL